MTLSIAHLYPTDGGPVVLALRGSLDELAASGLHAAITAEIRRVPRPSCIVVDLRDVDRVDPAGVGSLVAGNRLCTLAGVHLAVRGPSPLVRGLLRLRASGEQDTAPAPPAGDELAHRCTARHTARSRRPSRPRTDGFGPPGRTATASRPRRGR